MEIPQLSKTPARGKKYKSLLASIGGIVISIIVFVVARYVAQKGTTAILDGSSKQEIIKQTVQQLKSETPKELDEATTWTDVLEEPNAIRYVYTIHDIDTSQLSSASLKNSIAPTLCQTADTRNGLLDEDINMEYLYQVQNSTQTFFFSVSKEDCL